MNEKIELSEIDENDLAQLYTLAKENGGNKTFTPENFRFWYFDNPSNLNSLWKVTLNEKIEGYATTNNFKYSIDSFEYNVALPQNVLTSEKMRGKGYFGKLYRKTEEQNLIEKNTDFFLTVTGAMSTPIFLSKFDYLRAICPQIIFKPFSPLSLFSKKNYKEISHISEIEDFEVYNFENARKKNTEYFKWRYKIVSKKNVKIISVHQKEKLAGYAVLVKRKFFGLNTLVLADLICENKNDVQYVIDQCQIFCAKNLYFAFMMFELNNNIGKPGAHISLKNKFNFLIKGKTITETERLSKINFNIFFGDLDYFW